MNTLIGLSLSEMMWAWIVSEVMVFNDSADLPFSPCANINFTLALLAAIAANPAYRLLQIIGLSFILS